MSLKENTPIYLLYASDTSAEPNKMQPIGASSSFGVFCSMVASCIFNGRMEYKGKKRLEGFRLFHCDYRNKNLQFASLNRGHVEEMRDGVLASVPENAGMSAPK